ncbi:MAG: TIGR03619 family F420-dependent LLM class oxidoreductase [Acidimicrobiia bacterium]|nr:TIGR03619 family F420-dependent LLM class oxidoreductase [Acidimicrobiia bacterium]
MTSDLKVRIGYGLGTRTASNNADRFTRLVDGLEERGFDSLWLSERIGTDCPDPLVAMSFAVARTRRLKVGTAVLVLPGRNPVILAKSLASLDVLSQGRVLPAFGLGIADSAEHQAFGVDRRDRGGWFNEALPLMRRLWTSDRVTHHGRRFRIDDVTLGVKPVQDPLEIWLGGSSPLELDRVGRHGDGWLPSFCTPAQVAEGRARIEETAASHGRQVDPQHYGALIPYRPDEAAIPAVMQALVAKRSPGIEPERIVPQRRELPETIAGFARVGFSKFVLVPVIEPDRWEDELDRVAAIVLPLET